MDVDDTLVLILERIDSVVSLIRAASTCRRWRRLIADAGFLRRYRSLHGPTVAGDYCNRHLDYDEEWTNGRQWPLFVPSSSIDARHFSLYFILDANIFPSRDGDYDKSWNVLDSRSGLLLMECIHYQWWGRFDVFPNLVVCEPLTQRYRIVPQPPDFDGANWKLEQAFILDVDEDEAGGRISMLNFRVLCVLLSRDDDYGVAHTTVFTADGETDAMWSEKCIDDIASKRYSRFVQSICKGRVLSSWYFYLPKDGTLITHDCSIGKFTLSKLPKAIKKCYDDPTSRSNFTIANGGDGEPRIVTIMDHTMEVFARVDGEWGFQNKVLLSKVTCGLPGYEPSFFKKSLKIVKERGVGFIVISPHLGRLRWPFSVDLKTLEVTPAAKDTREMEMGFLCEFPWPPVLQVCVDR